MKRREILFTSENLHPSDSTLAVAVAGLAYQRLGVHQNVSDWFVCTRNTTNAILDYGNK